MKITIKNMAMSAAAVAAAFALNSCSLSEENPGGFTMGTMAESSLEGYQTLLNNVYFGMERYLYGTNGYMELTEGDTDLWTYKGNEGTQYTQYLWFYAGTAPNTTYTKDIWNAIYDGIGACNLAISMADRAPFKTEEAKNVKVAEARFMRAVYYFNAVEQFGGVTMLTAPATSMDFSPSRTDPLTIYKEVILPDLRFAALWLDKGTDATTTQPTKKSAMGMLAKACLQTREYGTDEFLQEALTTAKALIADCEAGGATYGAYMYATYDDVFKEANNWENKEALWKHRWYAGSDGHGSSLGNWKLNRYDEKFLCALSKFGAREKTQEACLTWDGAIEGIFMPTQYLLNLYVQNDGTLDPRFHKSFTTEWNANKSFIWKPDVVTNFDKDGSLTGKRLAVGDKAIKFVMPQDADYAAEMAVKKTVPYLVVDYKDVYNDASKNVNMTYNGKENIFRYFYPSLNKHNSSNYYVANAAKMRNGNLNGVLIMRMAEVYLIAAEADIYLNGGGSAAGYINKVRLRAGANALGGTATLRDVLDERARELCGEHTRFYDLKRTGMLKDNTYLNATHPDLGQYFEPEYALRPIPTPFLQGLSNGDEYQNPGY